MITKNDLDLMIHNDVAAYRSIRKQFNADLETVHDIQRDHYDDGPEKAVEIAIHVLGYDRAMAAIATMINSIGDWDGRISDRSRAWAKTVDGSLDYDAAAHCHVYTSLHSCHVEQIARYARIAERPADNYGLIEIGRPDLVLDTFECLDDAIGVAGSKEDADVVLYGVMDMRTRIVLWSSDGVVSA